MKPCFVEFNAEGNNGLVTVNLNQVAYFVTAKQRPNDATMIIFNDGKGVVVADTYKQVQYRLDRFEAGELDFKGVSK